MDVRVDGGPQDGTILVTWIPVTLNTVTARHVVPVTGYAVFADGKRVTDVDSPSSDHALVDLGCIGHFNPKLITVRSKSGDLLSNDSSAVPIQGGTQKRRQTRVSFTSRLADKYLFADSYGWSGSNWNVTSFRNYFRNGMKKWFIQNLIQSNVRVGIVSSLKQY